MHDGNSARQLLCLTRGDAAGLLRALVGEEVHATHSYVQSVFRRGGVRIRLDDVDKLRIALVQYETRVAVISEARASGVEPYDRIGQPNARDKDKLTGVVSQTHVTRTGISGYVQCPSKNMTI